MAMDYRIRANLFRLSSSRRRSPPIPQRWPFPNSFGVDETSFSSDPNNSVPILCRSSLFLILFSTLSPPPSPPDNRFHPPLPNLRSKPRIFGSPNSPTIQPDLLPVLIGLFGFTRCIHLMQCSCVAWSVFHAVLPFLQCLVVIMAISL